VAYVEDWLNKNKHKDFKANLGSSRTEQKTFNAKENSDHQLLNSESAFRQPTINQSMLDQIMRDSNVYRSKHGTGAPKAGFGKN
jgi:hypothetical protein